MDMHKLAVRSQRTLYIFFKCLCWKHTKTSKCQGKFLKETFIEIYIISIVRYIVTTSSINLALSVLKAFCYPIFALLDNFHIAISLIWISQSSRLLVRGRRIILPGYCNTWVRRFHARALYVRHLWEPVNDENFAMLLPVPSWLWPRLFFRKRPSNFATSTKWFNKIRLPCSLCKLYNLWARLVLS